MNRLDGDDKEFGYIVDDKDLFNTLKDEVTFYENLRSQVKLHSGDAIDLKLYEPAMRHLIDAYIRAEKSQKISEFEDFSLVQLIVERGAAAVDALPPDIRKNREAAAETIENNVRKLITDETPINPKYYERMSLLLDALIAQRRQDTISYQKYLAQIVKPKSLGRSPTPMRVASETCPGVPPRRLRMAAGGYAAPAKKPRIWLLPWVLVACAPASGLPSHPRMSVRVSSTPLVL